MTSKSLTLIAILALCAGCGSSSSGATGIIPAGGGAGVGGADAGAGTGGGTSGGEDMTALWLGQCAKQCDTCKGAGKDACKSQCKGSVASPMMQKGLKACGSICKGMLDCDDLAKTTCDDKGETTPATKDTPACKATEASCQKCMQDAIMAPVAGGFGAGCAPGCKHTVDSAEKSGTCKKDDQGKSSTDGFVDFCTAMCISVDQAMVAAKDTKCIEIGKKVMACLLKEEHICGGLMNTPVAKNDKACEPDTTTWQGCVDKHLKQGRHEPCKTGDKKCDNDKLLTCTNDKYDAGVACPKGTACMGINGKWDCHKSDG